MTDIEETGLSNGVILIHNTGVVDGHFPSREIDQVSGRGGAMLRDEGRVLHCRLPHAEQFDVENRRVAFAGITYRLHRAIRIPNQTEW